MSLSIEAVRLIRPATVRSASLRRVVFSLEKAFSIAFVSKIS